MFIQRNPSQSASDTDIAKYESLYLSVSPSLHRIPCPTPYSFSSFVTLAACPKCVCRDHPTTSYSQDTSLHTLFSNLADSSFEVKIQ